MYSRIVEILTGADVKPAYRAAMADAYIRLVQGLLLPSAIYYLIVTVAHWALNPGGRYLALCGLSFGTAVLFLWMRRKLSLVATPSLRMLELASLAVNLALFLNTVIFINIDRTLENTLYVILLIAAFATTSISYRLTLSSIIAALVAQAYFTADFPPKTVAVMMLVALTSALSSMVYVSLLRGAITRQVEARVTAAQLLHEAQIRADQDPLTGLVNRRWVLSHIDRLIAERRSFWFGIMDLDGFKSINDSYGHQIGDGLLLEIANRFRGRKVPGLTLGRLAGDEFALVLEANHSAETTRTIGEDLIQAVAEPWNINYLRLSIGATIGFSHHPAMGTTANEVYERADYALYQAKRSARGRALVFNPRGQAEIDEAGLIHRALREADIEAEMYYTSAH